MQGSFQVAYDPGELTNLLRVGFLQIDIHRGARDIYGFLFVNDLHPNGVLTGTYTMDHVPADEAIKDPVWFYICLSDVVEKEGSTSVMPARVWAPENVLRHFEPVEKVFQRRYDRGDIVSAWPCGDILEGQWSEVRCEGTGEVEGGQPGSEIHEGQGKGLIRQE